MDDARIAYIGDPEEAVEKLGPFRRRLLSLLDEPDSATGLARRMGTTRQRVNYHLHMLEEAGFVELAEVRQRRGLKELVMRRSIDVVLVDPTAFDATGLSRRDVVGLTGVVSLAADNIRQAAKVAAGASGRGEKVVAATLDSTIRVESPESLRSMLDEVAAVVARHDSGDAGLLLRVSTTVLPSEVRG